MSGPVILVTQDSRGRTCVDWYETEDGYYAGDPIATATASTIDIRRNCPPETVDAVFHVYHAGRLGIAAAAAELATHTIAEPGAPLEPIQRSTAA